MKKQSSGKANQLSPNSTCSIPRFRRSLLAAAIIACTMPVSAQDSDAPEANNDSEQYLEEVTVTGQRTSLENATELKRASTTVSDSVVLDEAGKVPSTSLLEILERLPGVTMNRIRAAESPDGFSFEGSGIQIRGLRGTKTLLNGREVFSANGGSGLSWTDIGPELLSAVTVYKASRADLIEGGVAGTTNLQTHMPFDFKDTTVHAALSGSYGDYSEEITPAASVLGSTRFDVGMGEIGVLLDVAYSKIVSHDSNVLVAPYFQSIYEGETNYVPGGIRYTEDQFERVRRGLYGALQWRVNDNLEFFHTTFISERESNRDSQILDLSTKTPSVVSGAEFDDGVFVKGLIGNRNGGSLATASNSSFRPRTGKTSDFSTGFEYAGDGWDISGSYQYVDVESVTQKNGIGVANLEQNRMYLDLSKVDPFARYEEPLSTDPSRVGLSRFVWHTDSKEGNSHAVQLDAGFDLDGDFFKRIATGVRAAKREDSSSFVGTWWSATGRGWNTVPRPYVDQATAGDFELWEFDNFFKGELDAPASVWVPTHEANQSDQLNRLTNTYAACGPDFLLECRNDPAETYYMYDNPVDPNMGQVPKLSETKPETQSLYVLVGFENDSNTPWENFSGNFGLRWVNYDVESEGNFRINGGINYYASIRHAEASVEAMGGIENVDDWLDNNEGQPPGTLVTIDGEAQREGYFSEDYFLPSFNLKFEPADDWVFRYALTRTMTAPSYSDIRAEGTVSLSTEDNPLDNELANRLPNIATGYNYESGNIFLKPEVSLNNDFSIEWYPRKGTSMHLSLFHKSIEDKIIFNFITGETTDYLAEDELPLSALAEGGDAFYLDGPMIAKGKINAEENTIIQGAELGGRTYFDELPGFLNGFGIDANITTIASDSPSALASDMDGNPRNVPEIGLSDLSYVITLLYDKNDISARLAWKWRDRYLVTVSDYSTTQTYTNPEGDTIAYGLPVYGSATGRLDGSISYNITDSFNVKLDVQNITNEIAETEMEILPGKLVNRGYFVTDRRIGLHFGYEF